MQLQPWRQTSSPATEAQHDAQDDSVPQRAFQRPDESNACNEHSLELVALETDDEENVDVWNTISRKNNEGAFEGCFEGGESETATADSLVEPSPSESINAEDAVHTLEAPQTRDVGTQTESVMLLLAPGVVNKKPRLQ